VEAGEAGLAGEELLHGGLFEVALLGDEPVQRAQQRIHIAQRLRDGALFGERWKGDFQLLNGRQTHACFRANISRCAKQRLRFLRCQEIAHELAACLGLIEADKGNMLINEGRRWNATIDVTHNANISGYRNQKVVLLKLSADAFARFGRETHKLRFFQV
jgi:hypothetical protein